MLLGRRLELQVSDRLAIGQSWVIWDHKGREILVCKLGCTSLNCRNDLSNTAAGGGFQRRFSPPTHCLHASSAIHKEAHHGNGVIHDGVVEWSESFLTPLVDLRTCLKHVTHDPEIPAPYCHVQWCVTKAVGGVHRKGCNADEIRMILHVRKVCL